MSLEPSEVPGTDAAFRHDVGAAPVPAAADPWRTGNASEVELRAAFCGDRGESQARICVQTAATCGPGAQTGAD